MNACVSQRSFHEIRKSLADAMFFPSFPPTPFARVAVTSGVVVPSSEDKLEKAWVEEGKGGEYYDKRENYLQMNLF